MEVATLAGGCFWCTEAIFKRLKGVSSVVSGYTGDTSHAEAIQTTFDPTVISYEKLLEVFFRLHDPTTPNQQGNDVGTQYRSAIFYQSEEQRKTAESVKKRLEDAGVYKKIVTEIVPATTFYPAEDYHQDFYTNNSYTPYCQYVIDPKISKLLAHYREDVKSEFRQ
ncbi:peptide-methionine (S)-S-oxide reductase MsrA [Candidatus Gottesmanbacteria bacterium]|nr:peptide-methionine (S)-S-oxide reductase MsrA [Candidatus Gottesmanbacteria bacterium]